MAALPEARKFAPGVQSVRGEESLLTPSDLRRLFRLLETGGGGCLNFQGRLQRSGHGTFKIRSRQWMAHRAVWLASGRDLAQGERLRHLCNNPRCCNPLHLAKGGQDLNMRDMAVAGRGRRSATGFPFGVHPRESGRFEARVRVEKRLIHAGTFDTWQVASAVALYAKNKNLYPGGEPIS